MRTYKLHNNRIEIVSNNGSVFTICFNKNSGKVYFRYKVGTFSNIKHPGIFLGVDLNGIGYFLHNHYHCGKAHITTEKDFAQGMPLYIYNDKCSNTPLKVIEIGLNEMLRGESYKPVSYNCQTYTNTACHNTRKSEDAEKWVGGIALVSIALLLIGAVTSSGR